MQMGEFQRHGISIVEDKRGACLLTFSHVSQLHQKLIQFLLPIGQFTAATEVHTKAIHDTVDNQQPILAAGKLLGEVIQQLELVLAVERSGVCDVLLGSVWVHAEPLCNLDNALGPKCTLCVDIGLEKSGQSIIRTYFFLGDLPLCPRLLPFIFWPKVSQAVLPIQSGKQRKGNNRRTMSRGSCAVTDIVCESWVFPHRNSPKTSLMLMLWKPLK